MFFLILIFIFICRFLNRSKKPDACLYCPWKDVDYSSKEANMQVAIEFHNLATHGKRPLATSVPQHLQVFISQKDTLYRVGKSYACVCDIHKIELFSMLKIMSLHWEIIIMITKWKYIQNKKVSKKHFLKICSLATPQLILIHLWGDSLIKAILIFVFHTYFTQK